jgi:hypothetical protein
VHRHPPLLRLVAVEFASWPPRGSVVAVRE